MNSYLQVLCVLSGLLIAPAISYAGTLRAHLEVNVYNGAEEHTIRTAANVTSGTPLAFDVGKQHLSLLFSIQPVPSDTYSLTVSLASLGSNPQALHTPLFTQVFHSRLVSATSGPLEFEGKQGRIKISGTVALSRIR